MNRRTALTATAAALVAGNALAAPPVGIDNPPKPLPPNMIGGLMYPPGYRLGIDIAETLEPYDGHWSELASPDWTLHASFHVRVAAPDEVIPELWWRPSQPQWRLNATTTLDGNVERRLYANPENNGETSGEAAFFLSLQAERWYEGIDLRTSFFVDGGWGKPPEGTYKRWRPVMERVLATGRLRDPLPIPQVLQEMAIAMEFGGFHPTAAGGAIRLFPEPPGTPGALTFRQSSILMGEPGPMKFLANNKIKTRDDLVASFAALTGSPGRHVAYNGIEWFIPPPFESKAEALCLCLGDRYRPDKSGWLYREL